MSFSPHDVRHAAPRDLEGIRRILNDEIRNGVNVWHDAPRSGEEMRDWFEQRVRDGYAVLVVERDREIAGYASSGPFRPHSGYRLTLEHSVYVDPRLRGRGVARALMTRLIEVGTESGFHAMIGGVEAGNRASLALHASLGFEEVGRLPEVGQKFGRWLTLVFVQRRLTADTRGTEMKPVGGV